jgi:hypothetical protein
MRGEEGCDPSARETESKKLRDGIRTAVDAAVDVEELHRILTGFARNLGPAGSEFLKRGVGYTVFRAPPPAGDPATAEAAVSIENQDWTVGSLRCSCRSQ